MRNQSLGDAAILEIEYAARPHRERERIMTERQEDLSVRGWGKTKDNARGKGEENLGLTISVRRERETRGDSG